MARWCAIPQLSGDGDISLCASDSESLPLTLLPLTLLPLTLLPLTLLPLTLLPLTLLPPPADQYSEKNSLCTVPVESI
jgi:hypothetical protein